MPTLNTIKSIANYAIATAASALFCTANAGSLSVVVVDKEGKPTADAVVVLVPTGKGAPKVALPMSATIAQEKMQFVPALSVVSVGAKLRFVNNDPWDHHVRGNAAGLAALSAPSAQAASGSGGAGSNASANGGFELRLEGKSEGKPAKSSEVTVSKPGAQSAVLLGCFLHGSMRGHVYVSDSPWAAKTAADGSATFDDVPDGAVQVRVWQADQLLDLPVQNVTVGAAPTKLRMQLQVTPRRPRGAPAYAG